MSSTIMLAYDTSTNDYQPCNLDNSGNLLTSGNFTSTGLAQETTLSNIKNNVNDVINNVSQLHIKRIKNNIGTDKNIHSSNLLPLNFSSSFDVSTYHNNSVLIYEDDAINMDENPLYEFSVDNSSWYPAGGL